MTIGPQRKLSKLIELSLSVQGITLQSIETVKKSIVNDKPNTKLKSNSFSYFGMKTWNELPKCIINSPSVESFKIRLKTFLRSFEYQLH